MYVHLYVGVCPCIHECSGMHTCVCVHACACMHEYVQARVHVCIVCACLCICACVYMWGGGCIDSHNALHLHNSKGAEEMVQQLEQYSSSKGPAVNSQDPHQAAQTL